MTQEEQIKAFEQALEDAWEHYRESGAAIVDALEENTQELAFAKGFNAGYKQSVEHPTGGALLHVLNKGCAQGYKDAAEKTIQWIKDVAEEWKGSGFKQVECEFATINDMIEDYKEYMEEQQ